MENYKPEFSNLYEAGPNTGIQFLPMKKIRQNQISEHRRFASQLNPNIDISDPICRQKYIEDDAFAKKKELRRQSLKKITSGLRIRSLSTFGNFQHSYAPITDSNDKNSLHFFEKRESYENFPQQKFKLSCVKLQKSEGMSSTLDWGKKNRKKTRRTTDQGEFEKNSHEQSTIDYAREQNYSKLKSIQFKKSSMPKQFKCVKQVKKIENQPKVFQFDTFKVLKKADFEIGKKLGNGNFSTAYLVKHKKTGFICALKVMSKQKIIYQQYEGQIARQIKIQSFMKHKNIVQLYGVFQDHENIYLLVEFCVDGHLFSQIRKNSRLDEQTTCSIVKGISSGIEYMHHEAIIHRDLKPENIFLTFGVPKVGDFGWAVYQGQDGLLRKTTSGSPLYYSPQIVQKEDYDEKVDVWGIGTITFECLIGMAPFKVYSLMNLTRIVHDSLDFPSYVEVSKESIDFIERCLKKKAEERWSVTELLRHQFFRFCSQ